jgi:23S rRNA (uracil1939-C5)-methyltransferase
MLGFHIPGMFDKVLDIDKCWLQMISPTRSGMQSGSFAWRTVTPFFDLRNQVGLMRTLIIRKQFIGE